MVKRKAFVHVLPPVKEGEKSFSSAPYSKARSYNQEIYFTEAPQSTTPSRVIVSKVFKYLANNIDGFVNVPQARAIAYRVAAQVGTNVSKAVLTSVRNQTSRMMNNVGSYLIGDGNDSNSMISSPARRRSNNDSNLPTFKGQKLNPTSNTSYALSGAPNPKAISLNSGILPNTFINDYMFPVEGACSPLHMTCTNLAIPTAAANPLSAYFTNTICFDIQTKAQANVGFGVDISSVLSAANIVTTFNVTIRALFIYFYYSSILSYESNTKNKNIGMIALRQSIDTVTMSDLKQLGNRLEDTPIPPKVVEWVRYMAGTFLSSNTQGSPLLKLCPSASVIYGTPPTTSIAIDAFINLNATQCVNVNVLLRRCFPKWRIGTLYDCPTVPTYDKNFLSIFANMQTCNRPGVSPIYNNIVANSNTAVPYNTFSNNLDGLAFAMSGIYDSALAVSYPGIATASSATAAFPDNRYSYYIVSGAKGFYPVVSYSFLALSRQESSQYMGATLYTPHLFGTDKCQNVTGSALMQSGQNTLDFLFDTKSLSITGKMLQYSS